MKIDDGFTDIRGAAAHAKCGTATIWRWFANGRLTKYRTATGRVRVKISELDEALRPEPER